MPTHSRKIDETSDDDASLLDSIFSDPRGVADFTKLSEDEDETPPMLSRIGGSSSSHRNRIGSLFQESSRRNRRENSVVQMDSLERRLQLSDTPLLHAEDIAWPAGKDDGKGLLGVADILSSNLYGISASPDGTKFVVTGQYKKASIVDAKTGAVITSLQGHNSSVISSTWSPDGKSVFTASYDHHARQYGIDGTLMWDSGDLSTLVVGVDVSPDGKTLIIRRHEQAPLLVDLATKNMSVLGGSPTNVGDIQILEDNKVLIMENDNAYKGPANKVAIIDQATGTREWAGSLARQQATSIVATDDGQFVFAGADDGKITMFNSKNNTSMTLAVASSYVRDLTLDPTGTMLIAAMQSDLRVYDLKALMTTDTNTMPSPYVFAVPSSAVSVNGSVIFVNNTKDGSASRTMSVDLRKVPNFVERLKVLEDELKKDAAEKESGVRMKWVEVLKTVNFSDTPAQSLSEGAVIPVPIIGAVQVFRGGFTPVRITESGSLMTGINQGHATVRLNPAAYIESITLKKSGNGKGLFNFGNGYITLNSGETTIPVNREISEFSAVVYDTAVVEITGISVKGMELVPDPIFVLHEQDLLDQSVDLLANIDTLTKPWSIDPANRMTSLTDRTIALRDASVQLVAFLESFDIAADSPDVTPEQMTALRASVEAAADKVLLSMEERDRKADELWNLGLPDVSPALLQSLLSQNDSETIRLLTSDINLANLKREKTSTSVITDTLEMQDIGGAIKIHGLQGRSNSTLAEKISPIAGTEVIQSINFSDIPAQELKEAAVLTLPVIGNVGIYRGGFTPIRVTESGALGTGLYEGHATIRLEKPTYIESITVRKSGSGKSLFNFGNGYIELNDGETTISVRCEIKELNAVVRDTTIIEITGISVKTTDGPTGITETGQALSLDFASLTSPVVSTSFVVTSSQPTDTVKVSFLRGSKVIETRTVLSGDLVDFEHAEGITGVILENVQDQLSNDAATYREYLQNYTSGYLYPWQDPGPRYHFFNEVRKDLASREAEIVAEESRGIISHPVSLSQLSVTSNMGEAQDVSTLSAATNPLYSTLSSQTLATFPLRQHEFGGVTPVEYRPNEYNVYNLIKYSGGPRITNVYYKNASGEVRPLPAEMYSVTDNQATVYPTGQDMHIGILVSGGTGYASDLKVGQNFDYIIRGTFKPSLPEALPPQEAKVEIGDITLMNYNSGGNAGWRTGSSLQYSGVSPVAIGTIKARAQIENKGQTAINFTVKVYSGNVGIDGWDRLQYSYKGSLGAGDSRGLVTPVGMNTDSQGRSYVRFVVIEDITGKILAEGGKTVGAAGGAMSAADQAVRVQNFMKNWTVAMQQAQADTAVYLTSIGITPPPVGDYTAMANAIIAESNNAIPVADAAATERELRIAYRGLAAAKQSGDASRIAMEQKRVDNTIVAHQSSTSLLNATPGAAYVQTVAMVLNKEFEIGGTLIGKMKSAEEGMTLTKGRLMKEVIPELRGTSGEVYPVKISKEGADFAQDIYLSPQGSGTIVIDVPVDMMANLWVDSTELRSIEGVLLNQERPDVNMFLNGGGLKTEYHSDKKGQTGESVSSVLSPGRYYLTIIDGTSYDGYSREDIIRDVEMPKIPVHIKLQPRNSANIEGKISIDKSQSVMDVSMKVAKFIGNDRVTDYSQVPKLNPALPVWVVVHGMDSKPEAAVMNELTKALVGYDTTEGIQVVTIDWKEAAASGFIMTQDAPWTTVVGKWVANQLLAEGFSPSKINVAGWSHGTFVAYEMADELKKDNRGQVNTIVALDAARNLPIISGYNHKPDFASVTQQSIAFDSSVIAGDDNLATKADYSFMVRSNEVSPSIKHKLAVTTFTSILNHERQKPGQFSSLFTFKKLMGDINSDGSIAKDAYSGGFEGYIHIGVVSKTIDNETYYEAFPSIMRCLRAKDDEESIFYFDSTNA